MQKSFVGQAKNYRYIFFFNLEQTQIRKIKESFGVAKERLQTRARASVNSQCGRGSSSREIPSCLEVPQHLTRHPRVQDCKVLPKTEN